MCQSRMAYSQSSKDSADSRLIWQGAAPCAPFQHLICILWPFSVPYVCPAALFNTLYAPDGPFQSSLYAPLSVRLSASVCVCMCL